ncbi:hypothetical protein [Labilithrix luteola]|nr:hypothetical protein [Labilithrix luteola]
MNRKHLMGSLLVAAVTLLTTGAYADNPHAAPHAKADDAKKGDKAGADKGKHDGDKDKNDKADKDKNDKGKSDSDRAGRRAKEHEAQREKLKGWLKGAPDEAVKQELRRHAERLARLDRIKTVAQAEKDTATVDKVTTLIAKEEARHDKWVSKHASGAAPAAASGAAPTPAADTKGGAK